MLMGIQKNIHHNFKAISKSWAEKIEKRNIYAQSATLRRYWREIQFVDFLLNYISKCVSHFMQIFIYYKINQDLIHKALKFGVYPTNWDTLVEKHLQIMFS